MEILNPARNRKPLPPQDVLNALLQYDPETGLLIWKPRQSPQFNGQFAGKPAFTFRGPHHLHGRLLDVGYLAHRVIWKMLHGDEPHEIDHINGDGFANRLRNLRAASRTDNARNMKRSGRNTSGAVGVSFVARVNRWRAYLGEGSRHVHLGYFPSKEAACAARAIEAAARGYHVNHGRDR